MCGSVFLNNLFVVIPAPSSARAWSSGGLRKLLQSIYQFMSWQPDMLRVEMPHTLPLALSYAKFASNAICSGVRVGCLKIVILLDIIEL